jgi:predicted site-specific integrase-resolvase
MDKKIKTIIVADRNLWNKFKSRFLEKGINEVSGSIEEMIREELVVEKVVEGLSELLTSSPP